MICSLSFHFKWHPYRLFSRCSPVCLLLHSKKISPCTWLGQRLEIGKELLLTYACYFHVWPSNIFEQWFLVSHLETLILNEDRTCLPQVAPMAAGFAADSQTSDDASVIFLNLRAVNLRRRITFNWNLYLRNTPSSLILVLADYNRFAPWPRNLNNLQRSIYRSEFVCSHIALTTSDIYYYSIYVVKSFAIEENLRMETWIISLRLYQLPALALLHRSSLPSMNISNSDSLPW